jgi:membrane protease YdiL (CAAX protease family)
MRLFLAPDELHPGQQRLRAGWRILGQLSLMTIISIAIELALWQLNLLSSSTIFALIAAQAGTFIAINASVFFARRFLDRRSFTSLGLYPKRSAAWDLLAGFMIAGVIMVLIYIIEIAAGWIAFEDFAWQSQPPLKTVLITLVMLGVFVIVGWQEELLARGYLLQNLAEGLNLFWGVLLSSFIFALGHLFNPNMSLPALIGLVLAGLFLAYAYLRTRRLWLPIGLHIGWNFFESTVLGFPVSGLSLFGLLENTLKGPELYTGGAFGPEAGLVLLPALALGTILVYYYTRLEVTQKLA